MSDPKAYFDPDQDHVLVSTADLESWNAVFKDNERLREERTEILRVLSTTLTDKADRIASLLASSPNNTPKGDG